MPFDSIDKKSSLGRLLMKRVEVRDAIDRRMRRKRKLYDELDALMKEFEQLSEQIILHGRNALYPQVRLKAFEGGDQMDNVSERLRNEMTKQDRRIRQKFYALHDDAKREVDEAYLRHLRSCKKAGIEPESSFLREFIGGLGK